MVMMGGARARAVTDEQIRAEIRRDYPGWNPWQSDAGRWWAARTGRTVDGDTPDELRAVLAEQESPGSDG
jgi:hypothetical protein